MSNRQQADDLWMILKTFGGSSECEVGKISVSASVIVENRHPFQPPIQRSLVNHPPRCAKFGIELKRNRQHLKTYF
jgi:hypothetical protein